MTSPPDIFTSLEEVQAYIEDCKREQVRFEECRGMVKDLFIRHKNHWKAK